MFEIVDSAPQNAVIKVIGVGGGGGNAVQHMVSNDGKGVDVIALVIRNRIIGTVSNVLRPYSSPA